MTLKAKSIIISFLTFAVIILLLKLFGDYNSLNNSIITNLLVTENILSAEDEIYKSLSGGEPDIETAQQVVESMPQTTRPLQVKGLTRDELHHLVTVKMSFIRIGRLLQTMPVDKKLSGPETGQVRNELVKIETSVKEFRESFSIRTEREKTFKKNMVTVVYLSAGLGVLFVLIGFYRYFIGPILTMSAQIKAVRDGRRENISPYNARDELGRLSDFTYQTLDELRKSHEALSERYGMQYAISEIIRASQKTEDIDAFLKMVIDTILSIKWLCIQCKGGISLIDDKNPDRLVLRAEKGFSDAHKNACREVPLGACLCGKTALSGKSICKPSCDNEHEITYDDMSPHGHYCVPIKQGNSVLGVLNLYLDEGHVLSKTELEFIEAVSMIIAETLIMKRLAESEHLITRAVEESGEGVMIANRKGIIEYTNPALERITGYAKSELLGTDLAAHIGQVEFAGSEGGNILDGTIRAGVAKNRRKDGKEYQEYITVIPVRDETGAIIKFVSIRRDITKERLLEDQLAQAQKMELIGRLAGGIAHDFNNYMTAILGYSGIVMKGLKEDSPARKGIETMINAAKMAANLTRQLLAFSRKQIIRPEVLNLNSVIQEMEKMLRRVTGEDIEFEVVSTPELWNVRVDAGQIEQVLMNLVVNAKDAMPGGGRFVIETSNAVLDETYAKSHINASPGEYVMLSVSDTGHGMTDEVKTHIFEPFFTTKEKGKGTGLGLAMVHGIVKQNNGHIHVYSEYGSGTTFRIYLPRVQEQAERERMDKEPANLPRGTETVLVVEDQEAVRQVAADILSGLGYTVIEARDGADALDLCGRYHGRIHLLLTDVIMPKMGGRDLADKIRELHPEIRVLYMSGYTDDTIAYHGILNKGIHLIHKPFTESGLAKEVRKALDT